MRILADAIVALGFIENHGGRYQNSATALSFLTGHGNEDLRPLLRYLDRLNYSIHTEPMFAALMAGAFLLRTGEGDIYSEQKVRNSLQASDWRQVDHRPLGNRSSVIVATTAS
jgi:hypothetical protein